MRQTGLQRQEKETMHANKGYLKLLVIILILVTVLPCAGFGASSGTTGEITASGTVRKQGITTYMYERMCCLTAMENIVRPENDSIDG
jgi:hypothetical protein